MNQDNLTNIQLKNNIITISIIIGIALGGFILRLFFFPFEIPLVLDGLAYFWYGIDMSVTGKFPVNYDIANNFWPSLLSIVFSLYSSNSFIDYMNLQRIFSSVISVLTIIPLYFLLKNFFPKNIAIVGITMFVFEPRVVSNSILGITEPLFILFGITTIWLFLKSEMKIIFFSFVSAGLFSLVRYEGLLIIIPMTVIFFIRYRKEKRVILKYSLAITIFIIVLLPMSAIRMTTMGYDGLFSHVKDGVIVATTQNSLNEEPSQQKFFPILGINNLGKFVGWILIPSFIIFIPLGVFFFVKNREWKTREVVIISAFLVIPAFYAYSRGISDTRYLFMLYPILIIVSLYSMNFAWKKINYKNWMIVIVIISIIISSGLFLEIKLDNKHEVEAYEIASKNTSQLSVINEYYPESTYYRITVIQEAEKFPTTKDQIPRTIKILPIRDSNSIEDFLVTNEQNGLKHIIVDNMENRPKFLKEIFSNEEKYVFLKKIYDSNIDSYDYQVKIFEIDYDAFNKLRI